VLAATEGTGLACNRCRVVSRVSKRSCEELNVESRLVSPEVLRSPLIDELEEMGVEVAGDGTRSAFAEAGFACTFLGRTLPFR
jgi:hypothetical protein